MKNTVYFDLETRRSATQVGGWEHTERMGMSVGVTFSTADNTYRIFREEEAEKLIEQLRTADLVVGYNHVGFDYGVLQAYTFWTIADVSNNLDLCTYLSNQLGHRLKLDSVAKPTLGGHSKTAEGTDALKWWATYEQTHDNDYLLKIARYCCYDVKVTMEVHKFGVQHGHVLYENRRGEIQQVPVDWASDC